MKILTAFLWSITAVALFSLSSCTNPVEDAAYGFGASMGNQVGRNLGL